jgi:HD-like signal output (HDOD) protein
VETVVEQNRIEVDERAIEKARERLDAYLRAWRLPDDLREEIAATVLACATERLEREPELDSIAVAIEECEKAMRPRLNKSFAATIPPLTPNRPPETYPMTMQTSLTRLPSFRIIAGWFVLIALIVLAFILTR